jgi:hypothetical protein
VNGSLILGRHVSSDPLCSSFQATSVTPCSYPCQLQANGQIDDVYGLLTNDSYLADILSRVDVRTSFNVTKLDQYNMLLSFVPCNSSLNTTYIQSLMALLLNSNDLVSSNQANCTVSITTKFAPVPSPALYYLALLGLLLVLIPILMAIYYFRSPVHHLPKEISWSFLDRLTHPWRWTSQLAYHSRGKCFSSSFL